MGFPSKRLPETSAIAAQSRLHQLAAEQSITNSWQRVQPVKERWENGTPDWLFSELLQTMDSQDIHPSGYASIEVTSDAAGPWADAAAAAAGAWFFFSLSGEHFNVCGSASPVHSGASHWPCEQCGRLLLLVHA